MKKNVILIGFMGAGKTTVGKAYAHSHHMNLLDTDTMIEEAAGITISEIFALQGEGVFRSIESAVLKELLLKEDGAVISVGGGLPLKKENRKILRELGVVVYLEVSPEEVFRRLAGDTTRPLLQGDKGDRKVKDMIHTRDPIYRDAAHLVVSVNGCDVKSIVKEVEKRMGDLV